MSGALWAAQLVGWTLANASTVVLPSGDRLNLLEIAPGALKRFFLQELHDIEVARAC